ncbi:MAG: class I tRNA ligase family protein, partial [Patescibacteria group bacterium]
GKKVIYDKRLREHNFGVYNGRSHKDWHSLFGHKTNQYIVRPPDGENLRDVQKRMMDFLKETDRKYEDRMILIISHANPIIAAASAYQGYKNEETFSLGKKFAIDGITGSILEMPGHNWPYNHDGDLDLHRPHVDELILQCQKCGGNMKRVKEVIDVWFDSGAMPFAQCHWPFSEKLEYPADFISEGIDQTRGWFYTLHAVGALMGKGPAYKNVISLGHILDEKGEKMSKSKGNVVDPWEVINKYGIDALRWYFFTINPPGEPKRFVIRDVEERLRRFVLTLSNVLSFYKMHATEKSKFPPSLKLRRAGKIQKSNILDKWILSRLNQTMKAVKNNLDEYEVAQAARPIDGFVDDLSRWWLRRSRKRFSDKDRENALAVLGLALEELSKLIAPFTPFLAEHIWQELNNRSSVHLADYPKPQIKLIDKKLEEQMDFVREIAAKGLALRAEAGIKVRQPLQKLKINPSIDGEKLKILDEELLNLIKDEVNVKEVIFGDDFKLDVNITEELKEEGAIRELARQIQEMRKDGGLTPKDSIKLYFKIDSAGLKDIVEKWQKNLSNEVGAQKIEFVGKAKDGLLIDRHSKDIWIGIIKMP